MAIEGAEIAVRLPRKVRSNPTLTVVGVVVFIAALKLAREFVVAVLIGILISYALRSMVDRLEALRVPRPVAAALILLALIGGSGWIVYSLSAEASVMIEKLPDSARKLRLGLNAMRNHGPTALRNVQEAANELQRAADAPAQSGGHLVAAPTTAATAWLRDYAVTQSTHLVGIAAQTPVVLLLAYFLLASGAHFRRKLVQWVGPSLTRKKDALRMLGEIDAQVQRYTVCNAHVEYLKLASQPGLEHAGVWGFAAGVLDFVPYLGTLVVAIAAGIAAFLQFGTIILGLAAAGITMVIAGMIDQVFVTWLHSRLTRVNAAVLFIALLFFGWLWGIAGLLLSAPLVAIGKVICDRVDALKPVGELLGH